jgi:hypothetical protein
LIILPIVNIHRKYYGWRAALALLVLFYIAMAMSMGFRWDRTAVLNLVFLAPAAVLLWRFFRSGGAGMLRHMNEPMDGGHEMHHGHGHEAMH